MSLDEQPIDPWPPLCPVWVKEYGGPEDPYHRVEEWFRDCGNGIVEVRRMVVSKDLHRGRAVAAPAGQAGRDGHA